VYENSLECLICKTQTLPFPTPFAMQCNGKKVYVHVKCAVSRESAIAIVISPIQIPSSSSSISAAISPRHPHPHPHASHHRFFVFPSTLFPAPPPLPGILAAAPPLPSKYSSSDSLASARASSTNESTPLARSAFHKQVLYSSNSPAQGWDWVAAGLALRRKLSLYHFRKQASYRSLAGLHSGASELDMGMDASR